MRDLGDPALVLPAAMVVLAAVVFVGVWLWLVACVAVCVRDVLAGGPRLGPSGSMLRPHAVRVLVGFVAGTSLAAGAAPAVAAEARATGAEAASESVAGLRLPERTTGGVRAAGTGVTTARATAAAPTDAAAPSPNSALTRHVVGPGETLWGITERLLPAGSAAADVDRGWRTLYDSNRSRIGADPDLILPGTTLRVPGALHDTDPHTDTGDQP
jgi:hypothetical protein